MKVLQIHNEYRSSPGGEDFVVEAERQLLSSYGHQVDQFLVTNSNIDSQTGIRTALAGMQSIWSFNSYNAISDKIIQSKPDIVHVHNTFAVLSPSIFWAIERAGIPSVLTLHNYRLVCATSTLFRTGKLCDKCVGRFPLPGLYHRCRYNSSLPAGISITLNQIAHRWINTYTNKIDAFIVLSEAFAAIMRRAGLPNNKIHIKPNFVEDVANKYKTCTERKSQIVYVGQITKAKGIDFLLSAWCTLDIQDNRLIVIGDGPDKEVLQERYRDRKEIVWLGRQSRSNVFAEISRSKYVVQPARWLEPFGLSVIEAMMLSTPTIVPNQGSFPHIVKPDEDAFVYNADNLESLAIALQKALKLTPGSWLKFSDNARQAYLKQFTPEKNYHLLMSVYRLIS